jgi:hypothetical protein
VVDNGKMINEGRFNEFTSELIIINLNLKNNSVKGTDIGKMLKEKGYNFDGLSNLVK